MYDPINTLRRARAFERAMERMWHGSVIRAEISEARSESRAHLEKVSVTNRTRSKAKPKIFQKGLRLGLLFLVKVRARSLIVIGDKYKVEYERLNGEPRLLRSANFGFAPLHFSPFIVSSLAASRLEPVEMGL